MTRTVSTPPGTYSPFYQGLLNQKHLMIAGASGSGKSVALNGIIHTALARFPGDIPGGCEFILIDAKGVELSAYAHLRHTITHAVSIPQILRALSFARDLVHRRFSIMSQRGERLYSGGDVYVIIDEFADLMTTCKKEVVPIIQSIAQLGRAARVHLILCTQCPLAEILPTKIKCNFDTILALHTARAQDSRNIIGLSGCEKLPAHGFAYYQCPGHDITRIQLPPMLPDEEINARVNHWLRQFA